MIKGISISNPNPLTSEQIQSLVDNGYADGYAKYPIDHPCDTVTPYNNGKADGYANGYAQYPLDHPVIPPPPAVERGSLEFFNLYHGDMILQAIKRDGTQLGDDIYLSADHGSNYRYFDNNYFISNDVTIIRVNTDVGLKNMEIISYDIGSNAPKAVSPTHLTASPEHITLGNTWDCNYYPDLKTQYVFSELMGSIEIFTSASGDITVSSLAPNNSVVGNDIVMDAGGNNYKYLDTAYFVNNGVERLKIISQDNTVKSFVRCHFDYATGTQISDTLTYTNNLTIWAYPGTNWSYFFY